MSSHYAALPPTPLMASNGFSFGDVVAYAEEAIRLIQEVGPTVIDSLRVGFQMWQAFTSRNYSAIIVLMQQEIKDVEAIVAAIKNEFGLN